MVDRSKFVVSIRGLHDPATEDAACLSPADTDRNDVASCPRCLGVQG